MQDLEEHAVKVIQMGCEEKAKMEKKCQQEVKEKIKDVKMMYESIYELLMLVNKMDETIEVLMRHVRIFNCNMEEVSIKNIREIEGINIAKVRDRADKTLKSWGKR